MMVLAVARRQYGGAYKVAVDRPGAAAMAFPTAEGAKSAPASGRAGKT